MNGIEISWLKQQLFVYRTLPDTLIAAMNAKILVDHSSDLTTRCNISNIIADAASSYKFLSIFSKHENMVPR